ncbi:MAG: S1C family serine protease [Aerococcus sp.]|nr:S1C family serine protease [Aerococcus sp.]
MADSNQHPSSDDQEQTKQTTSQEQSVTATKTSSHHTKQWVPALVGGLLGAVLVGGGGFAIGHYTQSSMPSEEKIDELIADRLKTTQNNTKGDNNQSVALDVTTDVSSIVNRVSDAVVSVENLSENRDSYDLFSFVRPGGGMENAPNGDGDSDYQTASEGSGVIYKVQDGNAYIVTNNHVVAGSDALEVVLANGEQTRVELVGADPWTDLAVMKMPEKYAKAVAKFGDSSALKVGEPAIAIGSPLGSDFASTVTTGIISGLNRQVPTDINGDGSSDWTATAIQTDAAINPGNSGGALVNSSGQLIGINSMKISSDKVEGMGFAIPVNEARNILKQLEVNGRVIRPALGISMMSLYQVPLTEQESVLKLPKDVKNGVVVRSIEAGSPAEKAGLKEYDVITRIDGEEVKDAITLRQKLYSQESNAKVKLTFYREGKEQTVDVQLEPMDASTEAENQ